MPTGEREATLYPPFPPANRGFPSPLPAVSAVGGGDPGSRPVNRVEVGLVPVGGVVEAVMSSAWCVVVVSFPSCGSVLWGLAVARGPFGGRGSEDSSVCTVAVRGCRAGGDVHVLVSWSSGSSFVTTRLAPSSSWSLEVLLCRWSGASLAGRCSAPPSFGGRVDDAVEVGVWSAAEGSGRSRPDRRRCGLGVLRRPMFVIFLSDPVLRNRWILRLVKASWLGVLPFPGFGVDGGFFAGVRAG